MERMCYRILSVFFVIGCFQFNSFGQIKQFDRLEMLYAQGHYGMVYRNANRLLDKPDYDFSMLPTYYKSISLFQLSQRDLWFNRRPESLDEAKSLFLKVKSSTDGMRIFNAHIHEIAALKRDLNSWGEDLKRMKENQAYENLQEILIGLFDEVPDLEPKSNLKPTDLVVDNPDMSESTEMRMARNELVDLAKKQLGVRYQWAGNEPSGFDCSGFTSYVLKGNGKEIPRRAVDQYEKSKKLKEKQVQAGDLIFFDSGAGINHVGLIVSGKGQPLVMIHASSSRGIVITEIEKSEYWKKRVAGFGTYIH